MGGTLPVLTRGVTRQLKNLGSNIGLLYGSNNMGAFIGGFITGYILLQTIGISGALYLGALLNGVNVLVVLLLRKPIDKQIGGKPVILQTEKRSFQVSRKLFRIILWVFAIEGFTTLAYEILWTRIMLEASYDKTSYFYTTIIITFVGGLGIGSYIIHRFIDRIKNPVNWLARIEILIGTIYLVQFILFIIIAPGFREFQTTQNSWFGVVGTEQILFFLVMVPPVILMGFTLPLVSIIYTKRINNIGAKIGIIGMLDTIGSVAGAFVAGFLLLPLLGTVKSFLLIALVNIALGLWIIVTKAKARFLKIFVPVALLFVAALVISVPFDKNLIHSRWDQKLNNNLIYYEEGPAASVAVTKYDNVHLALSISGALTAYTIIHDIQVHTMLAALPWLCCEEPERALVVGLGLGVTARTLYEAGVPDIDIAEISPEVIHASQVVFSSINDRIIDKDNVHLNLEDGRAHLFQTNKKYDIITSNAIHPRLGNTIYTSDYYQLCKEKLTEKGAICQWLPTNWLNETEFKALIHSFTSVFDHSSLWFINNGHTILVGATNPLPLSFSELDMKLNQSPIKAYLQHLEYFSIYDILKQYWVNNETLIQYVKDAPLNTDNIPMIEYSKVVDQQPDFEVLHFLLDHKHRLTQELDHISSESYEGMRLEGEYDFLKTHLQYYMVQQYGTVPENN